MTSQHHPLIRSPFVMHVRPIFSVASLSLAALLLAAVGCSSKQAGPADPPHGAGGAMPVQVASVTESPVASSDLYVATIKSRRSATMQPQVEGTLTRIFVHSGQLVRAGQVLMQIDPLKQQATVQQQVGTEQQKQAVFSYNKAELNRQKQLFDAGIISRSVYDAAVQAYQNSTGDLQSAQAQTRTQRAQLAYYQIRAPFAGVVGDIPVHQGDYVSSTTLLTTVDENAQLEAYIYLPAERVADVKVGLPVELESTDGTTLARTRVNFLSPEVDNGTQTILAKAPVPSTGTILRNQQLVKARVTWSTKPAPVVPILAVSRIGGQSFVFVAAPRNDGYAAHQVPIKVGDTIGNTYPVLSGLKPGDKVILSGLQMIQEGMPVKPLG